MTTRTSCRQKPAKRTRVTRKLSNLLRRKLMDGQGGYDHVHFSINASQPLHDGMGTCSDDHGPNAGKVFLLGRRSDGRHYPIWGPVTVDAYRRAALRAA